MTESIKFKGKELVLPKNVLTFDNEIRQVGVLSDRVVVLLDFHDSKESMLNNLYAFRILDGEMLWQVQPVVEKYPDLAGLVPYVQVNYYDDTIHAIDYEGRNFSINPANGKIIDFVVTK